MRQVAKLVAVVVAAALVGGCSAQQSTNSVVVSRCGSISDCLAAAHSAGVVTHLQTPQGAELRMTSGFFYPQREASIWSLRLQFSDQAARGTVEEDATPMSSFQCVSTPIEARFATPHGRNACFVSGTSQPEVRYWSNGVFYKLYMLPPYSAGSVANARVILGGVLDDLD